MDEKYEFADDEKNGATKTLEPILKMLYKWGDIHKQIKLEND